MTRQTPTLVDAGEGQNFAFLNTLFTAKLNGEHTDGQLTAMEWLAARDFGPPLHRHRSEDELFYILEGRVWFQCGDAEAVYGPGALAWLPRQLPHQFQVRSDTARALQITTPAQFERFVATLGRPVDEARLPDPEEIDPAHVAKVCGEFDIEVLGPPPPPHVE